MSKLKICIFFLIILSPFQAWPGNLKPNIERGPGVYSYWEANHESKNLEEYFWAHDNATCGKLDVIKDPTTRMKGWVFRGRVLCKNPENGGNHRLYPTWNKRECIRGSYISAFDVWVDIPSDSKAWVSLATYTNKKNWRDLFGINLETVQGKSRIVLFHVPRVGLGRYKQNSERIFPKKQWVHIKVKVNSLGLNVYQDGVLILSGKKNWGLPGPGLCEAHWGLYAQGTMSAGTMLNDNIKIYWRSRH